MKNYIKPLLYIFGIILISVFVLTILNYFNIIKGNLLNIFKLIIPLISFFIGGIMIGRRSEQKGWINGIKLSLLTILIFIILSLIFKIEINFKNIFYYLILLVTTTFGSMIGINKKAS